MPQIAALGAGQLTRRLTALAVFSFGSIRLGAEFAVALAAVLAVNQLIYGLTSVGLSAGITRSDSRLRRPWLAIAIGSIVGCIAIAACHSLIRDYLSLSDPLEIATVLTALGLALSAQRWQEVRSAELDQQHKFVAGSSATGLSGLLAAFFCLIALPLGPIYAACVFLVMQELSCGILMEIFSRRTADRPPQLLPIMDGVKLGAPLAIDGIILNVIGQLEVLVVLALTTSELGALYAFWSRILAVPIFVVAAIIPRLLLARRVTGPTFDRIYAACGVLGISGLAVLLGVIAWKTGTWNATSGTILACMTASFVARWVAPLLASKLALKTSGRTALLTFILRNLAGASTLAVGYALGSPSLAVSWPAVGLVALMLAMRSIAAAGKSGHNDTH